jgi:uncharacterized damage-inducible protein DinB
MFERGEFSTVNGNSTMMTRAATVTLATFAALAGAVVLQAQNPMSTELKSAYAGIKTNVTKAAEKMPEDQYGFKASPDIRTFGALIGHIADAQTSFCSTAAGAAKRGDASTKTTKADLVAALKASFDVCDGVINSLTDADATAMIAARGGQRSKLSVLWTMVAHSNEEYGYLAVYMRIKGIVPPSTEP